MLYYRCGKEMLIVYFQSNHQKRSRSGVISIKCSKNLNSENSITDTKVYPNTSSTSSSLVFAVHFVHHNIMFL